MIHRIWHTDRSEKQLRRNGLGHVPSWIRQLLRHVRDSIRCPNRESSIQHARQERHPIRPPSLVVPFAPDERTTCMCFWHSRDDDDCDEPSHYNQEKAAFVQQRKETVAENDKEAAGPCYDDKGDKDVPRFNCKVRVEDGIHLNNHVCGNGDDRCQVKDPAGKVKIASEEA